MLPCRQPQRSRKRSQLLRSGCPSPPPVRSHARRVGRRCRTSLRSGGLASRLRSRGRCRVMSTRLRPGRQRRPVPRCAHRSWAGNRLSRLRVCARGRRDLPVVGADAIRSGHVASWWLPLLRRLRRELVAAAVGVMSPGGWLGIRALVESKVERRAQSQVPPSGPQRQQHRQARSQSYRIRAGHHQPCPRASTRRPGIALSDDAHVILPLRLILRMRAAADLWRAGQLRMVIRGGLYSATSTPRK